MSEVDRVKYGWLGLWGTEWVSELSGQGEVWVVGFVGHGVG